MPRSGENERPRITFLSPIGSRFGSPVTDARLVNAFAEKTEYGASVYKRPGAAVFQTLTPAASDTFTALSAPLGLMYTESLYQSSVTSITPTVLTFNIQQHAGGATYDLVVYFNGASPAVIINFGAFPVSTAFPYMSGVQWGNINAIVPIPGVTGSLASINLQTSAVTVVSPGNTTSFVPGAAVVDNTTYIMDNSATIFGSAIGNGASFSLSNTLPATGQFGQGVCLAPHLNLVVVFKDFSTEFFYDASNPTGSPLAQVLGATLLWGCVDAGTVQNIEGELIWLARPAKGSVFVARMTQGKSVQVSHPGVDRLLADASGPFFSWVYKDLGHTFYGLTAVGTNVTVVYDLKTQEWYQWTDSNGNYWPYKYSAIQSVANTVQLFQNHNDFGAKVYSVDEDNVTDLGSPIQVDVYTPNHDFGGKRDKSLDRMDFIADQGPGVLYSRWTEDDFKTFSNFRQVDLNVKRPNLQNNGTFRRRAWNFRYTAPYKMPRLHAVELTMEEGD